MNHEFTEKEIQTIEFLLFDQAMRTRDVCTVLNKLCGVRIVDGIKFIQENFGFKIAERDAKANKIRCTERFSKASTMVEQMTAAALIAPHKNKLLSQKW